VVGVDPPDGGCAGGEPPLEEPPHEEPPEGALSESPEGGDPPVETPPDGTFPEELPDDEPIDGMLVGARLADDTPEELPEEPLDEPPDFEPPEMALPELGLKAALVQEPLVHFWYSEIAGPPPQNEELSPAHDIVQLPTTPGMGLPLSGIELPPAMISGMRSIDDRSTYNSIHQSIQYQPLRSPCSSRNRRRPRWSFAC
jgi:hypothetical protein